jgi:hypothetical protein
VKTAIRQEGVSVRFDELDAKALAVHEFKSSAGFNSHMEGSGFCSAGGKWVQ